LDFINSQKDEIYMKQDNKEFKNKMKSFENSFISRVQSEKSMQLKYSSIRDKVRQSMNESQASFVEEEIEEIFQIREDYYLDDEKKIKLENVLLGFEVDEEKLTEEEKQTR